MSNFAAASRHFWNTISERRISPWQFRQEPSEQPTQSV